MPTRQRAVSAGPVARSLGTTLPGELPALPFTSPGKEVDVLLCNIDRAFGASRAEMATRVIPPGEGDGARPREGPRPSPPTASARRVRESFIPAPK